MFFEFKSLILLFDGYADRCPAKREELGESCEADAS